MPCTDVRNRISLGLTDSLHWPEVSAHLDHCDSCERWYRELLERRATEANELRLRIAE